RLDLPRPTPRRPAREGPDRLLQRARGPRGRRREGGPTAHAVESLERQAVAHRVLGEHVRLHELEQVVGPAGLRAAAAAAVAAERLAADHRPGYSAIHIEVADGGAAGHLVDRRGVP